MKTPLPLLTLALTSLPLSSLAGIISIVETNLAGDAAGIAALNYGEDSPMYVDRTPANTPPNGHQHNGPAFNSTTGLLSATGDLRIGLPAYLIGHDYVLFANNARDNTGYQAVITTDTPSTFYLLVDTRVNGPATATVKTNTTDPVLGGSLQWILDGGWVRMNTGLSPNGQGDFTAVDETGDGTGAGVGVNNFMAVYKFPTVATTVTVKNQLMGGNNIAVIAAPTAPPPDPIVSYVSAAASVIPGASTQLSWLISPTATVASIDGGIGDILPLTDLNGAGTITVNPTVNTTYTLTVNTPTGNETRPLTVNVLPLATYSSSRQRIDSGTPVVLNWRVRPDAVVSIEGIGNVTAQTDATGVGTLTVNPTATTDYRLTAEAEFLTNTATASVVVRPPGQPFALLDIGSTAGRAEAGSAGARTLGGGGTDVNGPTLPATALLSDTGVEFTVAVDNLNPDGVPVGSIDWRDRGDAPALPLNRLLEDFVKNNAGLIRVGLGQLPAGTYDIISYHCDSNNSQSDVIRVLVTDATGTARDTGITANASWPGHPANTGAPGIAGLRPGLATAREARFQVTSNGTDEVQIYFDSTTTPVDTELPLNGLWITTVPPRPADNTWALIDLGSNSGQPEPGSVNNIVIGNANLSNGQNLAPVTLTSRTGVEFQLAMDNLNTEGNPVGGLDWRDRGDAPDVPLAWLAEDFVKNNAGVIRATFSGLPAGTWRIQSYLMDPTVSQTAAIRLFVTDATRTIEDTLLTSDASYLNGDAGAPQLNGLNAGLIMARSLTLQVTANGTDDVILYFDSTLATADTELPLSAFRITSATPPQIIPVTSVVRTVSGGTASVAVTFTSEADKTYSVYGSADPANWGVPLTTTLAATGTATTYTESNIPLTTTRRFYQIRRN